MPNLRFESYTSAWKSRWDEFVDASRNGTFLLRRDYMDYHSDRFSDRSLLVFAENEGKEKLVALLPACAGDDDEIVSHAGLTYGGLILPVKGCDGALVTDIMLALADYYRNAGLRRFRYKAIPHIYHRYPAEEDIYAIFRTGGRLVESNLSSAIDLRNPIAFNENSRRNMRRAIDAGLSVRESEDFASFWGILSDVLRQRYATSPVHTLAEIELLHSRFPENIRLFMAYDGESAPVAGTVLYYAGPCVHAQYIGASESGKRLGALPLLFKHIIDSECKGAGWFDFGICNERHGQYLNEGLLSQKNGMGGRGITYNIFEININD